MNNREFVGTLIAIFAVIAIVIGGWFGLEASMKDREPASYGVEELQAEVDEWARDMFETRAIYESMSDEEKAIVDNLVYEDLKADLGW